VRLRLGHRLEHEGDLGPVAALPSPTMVARPRRWTALAIGLVALSAIAAALQTAAPARGAGCYSGKTFPIGDPHHVYAIPGGCTWLLKPDTGYFSIGPQFRTRIDGTDDGAALARSPLGEAAAACGMSTFVVRWPTFVVTARRVAWGDGTGCHVLPGREAVTWWGRFVWHPREDRRPARWEAVLERSSPPLAR
jgi:hypothetical protein